MFQHELLHVECVRANKCIEGYLQNIRKNKSVDRKLQNMAHTKYLIKKNGTKWAPKFIHALLETAKFSNKKKENFAR